MSHAGAFALDRNSPAGAAVVTPRPIPAPSPQPVLPLGERMDAKLAELEAFGYRIQWLEIGEDALVTLFTEAGEEAVRLDPDPDVDKAWYRDHEVRAADKTGVWFWIEGEVEGELSAHVIV
ncbi:MAG: hypothetical protein ACJ798_16630 [Phenylobacterium sp.]